MSVEDAIREYSKQTGINPNQVSVMFHRNNYLVLNEFNQLIPSTEYLILLQMRSDNAIKKNTDDHWMTDHPRDKYGRFIKTGIVSKSLDNRRFRNRRKTKRNKIIIRRILEESGICIPDEYKTLNKIVRKIFEEIEL